MSGALDSTWLGCVDKRRIRDTVNLAQVKSVGIIGGEQKITWKQSDEGLAISRPPPPEIG